MSSKEEPPCDCVTGKMSMESEIDGLPMQQSTFSLKSMGSLHSAPLPRSMASCSSVTTFGIPEDAAAVLPGMKSRASGSQDPNMHNHTDAQMGSTGNDKCSVHHLSPLFGTEISSHL